MPRWTVQWIVRLDAACLESKMGFVRERKAKGGGIRFQAEVRLKGSPMLTAVFDRKTDAKAWIQKVEADVRCGRQQVYSEGRKHIFSEAVERYCKEETVSVAKQGHLDMVVPAFKEILNRSEA